MIRYRIVDRETEKVQGVYSRAYHDEYDFHSVEAAREANCHGIHKNKKKYRIDQVRITEEVIREGVDD